MTYDKKKYMAEWRKKNSAKLAEYRRKYYQEHKSQEETTAKKYREEHKEAIKCSHNQWLAKNKERVRATDCKWRKPYRQKTKHASTIVRRAIKSGALRAMPCEVCGSNNVEAHHDDYNAPLNVRWLCREHHLAWHKDNKPKYVGEK